MADTYSFRGKTMQYGRVGSIYLVVHAGDPPSAADWDAWLADIDREAPTLQGVLVYSEGGGPDARQRRSTAEMWARHAHVPPIAVITRASVVRLMVTALNYFLSRPIRGFAPAELDHAMEHHLKVAAARDREDLHRALNVALGRMQVPLSAVV